MYSLPPRGFELGAYKVVSTRLKIHCYNCNNHKQVNKTIQCNAVSTFKSPWIHRPSSIGWSHMAMNIIKHILGSSGES